MTNLEKEKIRGFREQGLGYKKISTLLGININSVKSFCQRNNLGGIKAQKEEKGVCPYCREKIKDIGRFKTRRFCGDTCRNKWWNLNIDKVNKKAFYSLSCKFCNKEFESYGNKNRKYCSHYHYVFFGARRIKIHFGECYLG